jgi:hypothetical protein
VSKIHVCSRAPLSLSFRWLRAGGLKSGEEMQQQQLRDTGPYELLQIAEKYNAKFGRNWEGDLNIIIPHLTSRRLKKEQKLRVYLSVALGTSSVCGATDYSVIRHQ